MPSIYRPCYCTRQEVQRALDIKSVAYNNEQVDRNIQAASDDVDGICARRFYPVDAFYKFDWPNFQYTYPWKLYFDQYEVISIAQLVTGTFLPQPIVIPPADYILRPENEGPPFTRLELRRDLNGYFGSNTTPQQDIGVTGTFGFWLNTQPGGTLTAAMTDTVTPSLQMSTSAGVYAGVGDVLIIDSERMLVTDCSYVSTAIAFNGLTSSPPSANDNVLIVPDGTQFRANESLVLDTETVRILNIIGNNLVLRRGWDGSILNTHTSGVIYANRQLTVVRGALGTTAATHSINAPINVLAIPGLVKELALATAIIGLTQEPAAYANLTVRTWQGSTGTTQGQQREPAPGPGLPDLRDRVLTRYGRKVRTRVV
jgi:hypothetical protein